MFSDQYELAVLRALRRHDGDGWQNTAQLTDTTGLPAYAVRSALASLRRRRLVDRGSGPGHWGYYSINERGMQELARVEQLRLVP